MTLLRPELTEHEARALEHAAQFVRICFEHDAFENARGLSGDNLRSGQLKLCAALEHVDPYGQVAR